MPRWLRACLRSRLRRPARRGSLPRCRTLPNRLGETRWFGLDDPKRAVAAVEPLGAVDVRQARPRHAHVSVATFEKRSELGHDRRDEPPRPHLPVDVERRPRGVDEEVRVLEDALVLPFALLRLAALTSREALEHRR